MNRSESNNEAGGNNSLVANAHGYPILLNEAERLAALQSYHILDSIEEKDFDDLTALASAICQTPVALVSLVDKDRQWFKSHKGLPVRETSREHSFCAHAINSPNQVMLVPDAKQDNRFSNNPLVTGETNITFYAGVPLVNSEGFALGTLCVIDHQSRELSQQQINSLVILAKQVIDKLELKRKTQLAHFANGQLEASMKALQEVNLQLTASEIRFRSLVQQAPVAISILSGRELRIDSANEAMLKLWRKTSAIIGQTLVLAVPELQVDSYLELLDNVFTTAKPYYGYEALVHIEDGSATKDSFYNFVYQPLIWEKGVVNAVMVVATNVTEQVEARNHINDTNERLALALDAGSLGSYDVNMDTGVMVCSEQCKKNYGLTKDAVFNFSDLLACIVPEYREAMLEKVNAAIAGDTVYQAEYMVEWPDGSRHWVAAQGKVKPAEKGDGLRIIGVTQNITERKEIEKRKDSFLSIVSHELKTPLTSLKSSLQLLDKIQHEPKNPIFPLLIATSVRSTGKINDLVDDLLHMHRFSENQLKLDKTWFTVWDVLHICCNHVRIAGVHELVIEGAKDILIYADEHRIDQVIVNLVNNAVKYAPLSKRIILSIAKENDCVIISVKDFGPGIPAADQPHLFERYWRADHSGAAYTGLGLGLYICAEIIKRHNGEIGVKSVLGEGSEFWFSLPAYE